MNEVAATRRPVRVVFILGFPRSGSTLLGNVLGQLEGWFFAGELRELGRRSQVAGARCGCGQPIGVCPVWGEVLATSGGRAAPDGALGPQAVDQQRRALRWGGLRYALARRPPHPGRHPESAAYLATVAATYRAVAAATGARVVVDSSKWPADAALAALASGIDPWFIHLVRDPRGVVHSRQRARDRRLQAGRHPRPLLAALRPLWLAYDGAGWGALNFAARHAPWQPPPPRWQVLSYEALAARPEPTLRALLVGLDEEDLELPFSGPSTVHLDENHAVAGNRNRHRSGDMVISPDEGWRRGLARWEQWVVATAGLPSLHAHGYRLRGADGSAQAGTSPSANSKAGSRHTRSASAGTSANAKRP